MCATNCTDFGCKNLSRKVPQGKRLYPDPEPWLTGVFAPIPKAKEYNRCDETRLSSGSGFVTAALSSPVPPPQSGAGGKLLLVYAQTNKPNCGEFQFPESTLLTANIIAMTQAI